MNLLKICALILFYFLSRVAMAESCESFQSLRSKETVCWNDSVKGLISKSCFSKNECDVLKFFEEKKTVTNFEGNPRGENPSAKLCDHLQLEVDIFRDEKNNERTFCIFKDGSMAESHAIGRHVQ